MHCKDTILRTQNNWPYSKLIPNSGISLYLSIPAATATGTVVSGPVGTVAGSAIPFTGSVVASSAAATILGVKSVCAAIGVGVAFGGVGGVVSE